MTTSHEPRMAGLSEIRRSGCRVRDRFLTILTCFWLSLSFLAGIGTGAPVLVEDEAGGSWSDTFNDTTGISVMNYVTVNETRGDVTLEGYWNNFDNEPLGLISGWTYEYIGGSGPHRIVNDPYESGNTLWIRRNDNSGGYREHFLWIEFDIYYEILDFDLTPWAIQGSNRQGYFYAEFYDSSDVEIHEVRYYWDDTRSGTPANSALLTAIDMGWTLPPCNNGSCGDIRYYLHENISEDIDANVLADLATILLNTVTFRYGFYQDAGSGLGIGACAVDNGRIMKQQSGHVRCLLRFKYDQGREYRCIRQATWVPTLQAVQAGVGRPLRPKGDK